MCVYIILFAHQLIQQYYMWKKTYFTSIEK